MLTVGTQRTLARGGAASATQTLAWAAATMIGRASASLRAVARLIGNRRSEGSVGAGFSARPVASGFGPGTGTLADRGDGSGSAEGSPAVPRSAGAIIGG